MPVLKDQFVIVIVYQGLTQECGTLSNAIRKYRREKGGGVGGGVGGLSIQVGRRDIE